MRTKFKNFTEKTLHTLEKIAGRPLTIGSLLLSIRESEGVGQSIFAKRLGVSSQYLCDAEHDRKFISAKMAYKFANILGYSGSQFVRLALQDELNRYNLHLNVAIYEIPQHTGLKSKLSEHKTQ
jgi:transcriptional regulator with XRE-family HTH domain